MKTNAGQYKIFRTWGNLILCAILLLGILTSCAKADHMAAEDEAMGSVAEGTAENAAGDYKTGLADKGGATLSTTNDASTSAEELPKKIVKNATVKAETKSFDSSLGEIETLLTSLGGHVESSYTTGRTYGSTGGNRSATLTMRIPAEKLSEFLAQAGGKVNVISSTTTAEDVTAKYYDTEARLSVLETERQVLENMLAKSNSVSEMITVEDRLYDVIYEIESYKTQLKLYDSMVAYSTVRLTLNEVTDLTVVAEDNTFGARMKQALGETWQNSAEFCKGAVIWLIYALPALIIVGGIGTAAVVVAVRLVKKKKTDKKQSEEKNDE